MELVELEMDLFFRFTKLLFFSTSLPPSTFLFSSTSKKLPTMPALAKAAKKATVPAGKGKKKQVSV